MFPIRTRRYSAESTGTGEGIFHDDIIAFERLAGRAETVELVIYAKFEGSACLELRHSLSGADPVFTVCYSMQGDRRESRLNYYDIRHSNAQGRYYRSGFVLVRAISDDCGILLHCKRTEPLSRGGDFQIIHVRDILLERVTRSLVEGQFPLRHFPVNAYHVSEADGRLQITESDGEIAMEAPSFVSLKEVTEQVLSLRRAQMEAYLANIMFILPNCVAVPPKACEDDVPLRQLLKAYGEGAETGQGPVDGSADEEEAPREGPPRKRRRKALTQQEGAP